MVVVLNFNFRVGVHHQSVDGVFPGRSPYMRFYTRHFVRAAAVLAGIVFTPLLQAAMPVIEIGALHGKLRYDVELFHVKPGSEVKLVLNNTDEMQHNLIICAPGANVTMKVAQKAWALGADALDQQYVPDMPEVLFFTKIVNPGQQDSITFKAPETPGDYPYVCTLPGHAFTMKGIMRVTDNPPADKPVKAVADKQGGSSKFHLHVMDKPVVKRAFVQDGPSRAVLVGLPGGINYCFDADTCCVRFGWFGMFLDVGPDWGYDANHRGGSPVKTLGERFKVGEIDLPIRIGSPYLTPQVEFKGYEWNGENVPVMKFLVNGAPVRQTVRPAPKGIGLQYDFEFDLINAPVFIKFDDRDVNLSSSVGEWKDGVLHVPHDQTKKFSVTVTTKSSATVN